MEEVHVGQLLPPWPRCQPRKVAPAHPRGDVLPDRPRGELGLDPDPLRQVRPSGGRCPGLQLLLHLLLVLVVALEVAGLAGLGGGAGAGEGSRGARLAPAEDSSSLLGGKEMEVA